jgi:cobalt/nickel transport system ATP-binding protein
LAFIGNKVMDIIQTKELSFTYPNGTNALRGINFSIQRGEFVGILGANGSGKTTFLKQLNGLLKPSSGNVFLEGKDIQSINRDLLFTKVCTVFQDPNDQLFSSTVSQDIAFGPTNMGLKKEEVQRRVQEALELVEMSQFAESAIHTLSYGQKKRICLAGVLAMRPEVILLDEPTSSLDPMGVSSIMHLLKKLNKEEKVTMVMSTHSVDLVPLFADRVAILSYGKIIRQGLPEEVFSDPEMIRSARLRLPRIAHLIEILKKRDGLSVDRLPLTIGEARRELAKLIPFSQIGRIANQG